MFFCYYCFIIILLLLICVFKMTNFVYCFCIIWNYCFFFFFLISVPKWLQLWFLSYFNLNIRYCIILLSLLLCSEILIYFFIVYTLRIKWTTWKYLSFPLLLSYKAAIPISLFYLWNFFDCVYIYIFCILFILYYYYLCTYKTKRFYHLINNNIIYFISNKTFKQFP